jgi:formate hydrogenlyase transcriptional activator
VGEVAHELLKTAFPVPFAQIDAELLRSGRWEGELTQSRKDGTQVVVAARWSVKRDDQGTPVAILVTTNDITQRKQAEENLRRSEAYLAEAQKLSHTGSWAFDITGDKYIYASAECLRIFGFEPEDALPTREGVFRRIHPDDSQSVNRNFDITVHQKVDTSDEFRLLLPDGAVKHVHVIRHPVLNSAGEVVQLFGTAVDITERKRAEEALRRSEQELRDVIETIPVMAFSARTDGFVEFVNRRYLDYTNLTRETASGSSWQATVHPDDLERTTSKWLESLATGEPLENELRHRNTKGEYRWFSVRAMPLRDEHRNIVKWYGVLFDIEDRKRAEEALRESETRFRTFVDHAGDALFVYDLEQGTVVDVNREACESLGYTREEIIGKSPMAFHADSYQAELQSVAERVAPGQTVFDTHWHRRKNGTMFPVEVHTSRVLYGGREFLLTVARDISDRLRAEEAVRQSEKQLREVIETMPAVAWTMSPDGSLEFVNKRWQEYTGMSSQEAAGFGWKSAFHPKDIDRYLETRSASLASGSLFEDEVRIRSRGGEYRWFISRAVPLRDEQGKIVRWYGTATDIHDRKQAEERVQVENVVLREEIDKASMFEEVVGASPALQTVLSAVSKVAPTDSTVLLTGQTGTGKELIARAIHKKSERSGRPFISVNCAAIPQSLIASELFGHEKGAFTGALQRHLGKFELAERGTIFLDEIGELPMETQVALLRVLQEREIQRVGGSQPIRVNVRILAATNRDLQKAIAAGTFREDLFYRLNVFPIHVPLLRERKEDIPMLVEYFIDRFARKAGKDIRSIDKQSLELLESYSWPGNIRELQNVVERSVVLCDADTLRIESSWLSVGDSTSAGRTGSLASKIQEQERDFIERALAEAEGKVSGPLGAAAKLGISPSALEYKIRLLKINKHQFKKYLRES